MTFAQVYRHVTRHRPDGPNWFERGLMLLAAAILIGAVLAFTGCEFAYPENQCAKSCGSRGYVYNNGTAFKSASCVCGPVTSTDGGR